MQPNNEITNQQHHKPHSTGDVEQSTNEDSDSGRGIRPSKSLSPKSLLAPSVRTFDVQNVNNVVFDNHAKPIQVISTSPSSMPPSPMSSKPLLGTEKFPPTVTNFTEKLVNDKSQLPIATIDQQQHPLSMDDSRGSMDRRDSVDDSRRSIEFGPSASFVAPSISRSISVSHQLSSHPYPVTRFNNVIFDDSALKKYIPKINARLLPSELRISRIDRFIASLKTKTIVSRVEVLQAILSILFCINFIVSSYFYAYKINEAGNCVIDIFLCLCFTLGYIFYFIVAQDKCAYIFSFYSVLDYITVIPTLVNSILFFIIPQYWDIYRPIEVFGILRTLRVFKLLDIYKADSTNSAKTAIRKAISLLLTIFSLVIVFACLIQQCENLFVPGSIAYFHDAVYFIFVTLTTIGFGDIVVKSILGKLLLICFWSIGVVLIPLRTSELLNILLSERITFTQMLRNGLGIGKLKNHIIVTGKGNKEEIEDFIVEFFHEQHGKVSVPKVVIVLKDEDVFKECKAFLYDPYYAPHIELVQGDIMDLQLMDFINLQHARAVFLLTTLNCTDPRKQDTYSLMCVLAIKGIQKHIDIYAEIILPESKPYFVLAGATVVVCIDDLKLKIMSQSLVSPGFSTMLSNLLCSVSVASQIKAYEKRKRKDGADRWAYEYFDGTANQIYIPKFSNYFQGMAFLDATRELFEKFHIILFALMRNGKVILNPYEKLTIDTEIDRAVVIAESVFHSIVVTFYLQKQPSSPLQQQQQQYQASLIKKAELSRLEQEDEIRKSRKSMDQILTKFRKSTKKSKKVSKAEGEDDDSHYHQHFENQSIFENIVSDEPKTPSTTNTTASFFNPKSDSSKIPLSEESKMAFSPTATKPSPNPQSGDNSESDMLQDFHIQRLLRTIAPVYHLKYIYSQNQTEQHLQNTDKTFYENAKANFKLLPNARPKEEFFIPNAQKLNIENHILVMGDLIGASYICLRLRSSKWNREDQAIVFMSSNEKYMDFLYHRLKFFKNVYFMIGQSTMRIDQRRANVTKAERAIYISGREAMQDLSNDDKDDYIVDSTAIKTIMVTQSLNKKLYFVTDVNHRSNITFFNPGNHLYLYNTEESSVPKKNRRKIIKSESDRFDELFEGFNSWETIVLSSQLYAAGRVLTNSFFKRLLCFSFFQQGIIHCVEELCGFAGYGEQYQSGFYQVPVPPECVNQVFIDVFNLFLTRKKSVILGIYRAINTFGNEMEYVYTSPQQETIVMEGDKLFVVGDNTFLLDQNEDDEEEDEQRRNSWKSATSIFAKQPSPQDIATTSTISFPNPIVTSTTPTLNSLYTIDNLYSGKL